LSNKKKRIFFRVDGDHGNNSGLGHINRTLIVYFYLKKKFNSKYEFFFITKNYVLGKKILKQRTREKIYIINKSFLKKFIFTKEDKIIIDTLGAEKKLLHKLKKENVSEVVSFDELNPNFYNKGVIINGIYFAKKKIINKNKNIKIYQGPEYILLNNSFINKKKINLNNNILISSGGADKKNFLSKVIKILINLKDDNLNFFVIIGKGVKKSNKIFKFQNLEKVRLIQNLNNLKTYFDRCNISITAGGTVMFESISSGKATLVIKTYEHQKYAIKYFKDLSLIKNLGDIKKIDLQIIKKNVYSFLYNKKIIDKTFSKNTKAVDGKGLNRIKNILIKYINR